MDVKTPQIDHELQLDFESQLDTNEERVRSRIFNKIEIIQLYITERQAPCLMPNPLLNFAVNELSEKLKSNSHELRSLVPSLDPKERISHMFNLQIMYRSCYILQSLILTRMRKIINDPFDAIKMYKEHEELMNSLYENEYLHKQESSGTARRSAYRSINDYRENSKTKLYQQIESDFVNEVQNIWKNYEILQIEPSYCRTVHAYIPDDELPVSKLNNPDAPELDELFAQLNITDKTNSHIPPNTSITLDYTLISSAVQSGYVNLT